MHSIVYRLEAKALYFVVGKRSLKRMARNAIGPDGRNLVDQCYKLIQILLPKHEAKRLINMILKILCELTVLVANHRLSDRSLNVFGKSMMYQFGELLDFPVQIQNRYKPTEEIHANLRRTLRMTIHSVEGFLVDLLDGYSFTKYSTINRIRAVSKILRTPEYIEKCFVEGSKANEIGSDLIGTIKSIAAERPEFRYGVSRAYYKQRRSKYQTEAEEQETPL